jgi:hypothetical protein
MDERDRTERLQRRAPWVPWAITSLALLAVAVIAYNAGAQREAAALATEPVRRYYYGGFGGIWLFFALFWIFGGLRWMWWGGRYYRPWGYGRYYPHYDEREDWEEWHRREHERMNAPGPTASSGSSSNQRPIT